MTDLHIHETRADLIERAEAKGWRMRRRSPIHFGLHDPNRPAVLYMFAGKGITSKKAWDRWSMDELRRLVGPRS